MTDKIIYKFKQQLIKFGLDDVEHIITQAERRHRTGSGEFAYSPLGVSDEQRAKIKETWPVESVSKLAEVNKRLIEELKELGTPKPDKERQTFNVLLAALTQEMEHEEDPTGKIAAAAISFALMRGTAPDMPVRSIVATGGKKFMLKPTQRPGRLVVDCDKVDNADAYLFALYDSNLRRSWLLGWATTADMRSSEYGNRITKKDVCPWRTMSFFRPMAELRPMADLMRKMGVKQVREGTLFESVPDASDLPVVPPGRNLDALLDNSPTKADEEFYKILGIEESAPEPKEEPKSEAPAPVEDDWGF